MVCSTLFLSHQAFDYNVIIVKERLQEEEVNEELEKVGGGGGVDEEKIKYEELAKGESQEKEQG